MNLKKFDEWPSDKATKRLIYLGFIVLMINFPFLVYLTVLSHYPAIFIESQLSFSGPLIRSHFREMTSEQIQIYIISILLDDVYDFCQITMFTGLSLYIARKFDEDSAWRRTGYKMVIIGLIGSISDMIENTFIIMMANDPQGFPDSWAVAHSCFATIKFITWGIQAIWIIWADVKLFKSEIFSKKHFLLVIGVVFAQHWTTVGFGLLYILGVDIAALVYG